jgi:hypothetical protein
VLDVQCAEEDMEGHKKNRSIIESRKKRNHTFTYLFPLSRVVPIFFHPRRAGEKRLEDIYWAGEALRCVHWDCSKRLTRKEILEAYKVAWLRICVL